MSRFKTNKVLSVEDGVARVDVSTPKHPTAVTLVDEADLPLTIDGQGRWCAHFNDKLYVIRGAGVTRRWLHRLLLGLEAGDEVLGDHRDGDSLNNRRSNLRCANHEENARNTAPRCGSTSKYLGVYWSKQHKSWRVECQVSRKRKGLGLYKDEKMAARAYDAEMRKHPFANLNFPAEAVAA